MINGEEHWCWNRFRTGFRLPSVLEAVPDRFPPVLEAVPDPAPPPVLEAVPEALPPLLEAVPEALPPLPVVEAVPEPVAAPCSLSSVQNASNGEIAAVSG